MLRQLVKKEILEHLMSLRFAITCVLCLMVILSSLFVRGRDYTQASEDYYESVAMERTRMDTIREPWSLPWGGLSVYRKPNPLKIFVRGVDESNGGSVKINAHEPLHPIMHRLQNPSGYLFPSMDIVSFVGLIMSLMAIVFGYDAICGEKQRGTLRLMLSYSVPRHRILLGKWIGGYLTLTIPFLITMIAGAIIVLSQKGVSLNDRHWTQLMMIMAFSLLYIAVMFSLAICVSCLTNRPSTSAMILLSLWVVFVLAIPNLSPYLAEVVKPAPNAQEIDSARREASEEIWDRLVTQKMKVYDKEHGFGEKWWEDVKWGEWPGMKPAFLRWVYQAECRKQGCLERQNAYKKIDQHYGLQTEQQIALSKYIGRVSPFTCFALAVSELADVGAMENERYMKQFRKYQMIFIAYIFDEYISMEHKYIANEGKDPGPWHKLRDKPVPAFYYVPAPGKEYVKAGAMDSGILAGVLILLFMISYAKFLRYDVR